jgi:hypothetical protein
MKTREVPSIAAQLRGITDQELARETLLKDYFNGEERNTVYTVLRSVSASGMSRKISLKVAQGGDIFDITYLVAQAIGDRMIDANGFNAIKVNGAGMDMGFHLVYSLSSVLYHGHERAGYVLNHRWL